MGWFDEQIRERMRRDQEVMEDSFVRLAGSVLGSQAAEKLQDERLVTKEALDEILRYYHMKPVQIPDEIRGFEDQLDYVLRPLGLMTRNVALREDWYRHAYGPMLGMLRENNMPVALLPGIRRAGIWCGSTGQRRSFSQRRPCVFICPFP